MVNIAYTYALSLSLSETIPFTVWRLIVKRFESFGKLCNSMSSIILLKCYNNMWIYCTMLHVFRTSFPGAHLQRSHSMSAGYFPKYVFVRIWHKLIYCILDQLFSLHIICLWLLLCLAVVCFFARLLVSIFLLLNKGIGFFFDWVCTVVLFP